MSDRFDELVGEIDDPARAGAAARACTSCCSRSTRRRSVAPRARRRSRRAGATLLPRRRGRALVLLAAALAAAVRSAPAGWPAPRGGDVEPEAVIAMRRRRPGATGSIELLPQDAAGNWPMNVLVRGLEPSRDRSDYYELWLTKDGKPIDSCGRFTVHPGVTTVS